MRKLLKLLILELFTVCPPFGLAKAFLKYQIPKAEGFYSKIFSKHFQKLKNSLMMQFL
jgi:hypothetical protein